MIRPPAALIFDYDGVLADTEPLHWKSWAKLLSPYGIEMTWEDYCAYGRGVDDGRLCDYIGKKWQHVDTVELSDQNRERKQLVRGWSLAEPPIPKETVSLLKALEGYRIGLVTSSERSAVEPVLHACDLLDKFDAAVFGEDVVQRKPSPEPYLQIRQKLGLSTGIVFEDSSSGVESALAAGFNVVRVENPNDLAKIIAITLAIKVSDTQGIEGID